MTEKRTQADREFDWQTGRELERKDAEIAGLRAERDRMRAEAVLAARSAIDNNVLEGEAGIAFNKGVVAAMLAIEALNAGKNSVAEPAHPRGTGPASDSGSDQGKQGGTAVDPNSQGRHGPHSHSAGDRQ